MRAATLTTALAALLAGLAVQACAATPGGGTAGDAPDPAGEDAAWTPPAEAPLPEGFPAPDRPGAVVVKEYPSYRGVFHEWRGDLDAGMRRSFWPLFEHIRANEIAMSAPVEAVYRTPVDRTGAGAMDVGFLYVRPGIRPGTVSGDVKVVDVPAMTVVSVGVEGRYDADNMRPALALLRGWLAERGGRWRAAGAPRRLFYQQPVFWKGAGIYSEVQIPIEPVKPL